MSLGSFLKHALKDVVKVGLPVLGTVVGGPLGGAGGLLAGAGAGASGIGGSLSGASDAAAGSGGGILTKIGSYALSHPAAVLGAVGAVQGMADSKHAGDLQQKALDLAQSQWDAGAPLRDAGRTGLLDQLQHPTAPSALPASNPYAAQYRAMPAAPGGAAPTAPTAPGGVRPLLSRMPTTRPLRRVSEVF